MVLNKLFAKGKPEGLSFAPEQLPIIESAQLVAPPMISVIGAKGGAGATSIAVNLAAALTSNYGDTTLVDANMQMPDAAYLLGQEPEHTMVDLLASMPNIDGPMFSACASEATELNKQLKLLSPPLNGEGALKFDLSQLAECLALSEPFTKCWVVDLPKHLDKHFVNLLDRSAKIVLVFESSVSSLAACHRWLTRFRELGYSPDRIVSVLNRAGSKYNKAVELQMSTYFAEIEVISIPNAAQTVWDSTTRGVPAALAYPHSPYGRAVKGLATRIYQQLGGERNVNEPS